MACAVIQMVIVSVLLCAPKLKRQVQNQGYLESLKEYDIDEMIEEEKVYREVAYTNNMETHMLEKLRNTK